MNLEQFKFDPNEVSPTMIVVALAVVAFVIVVQQVAKLSVRASLWAIGVVQGCMSRPPEQEPPPPRLSERAWTLLQILSDHPKWGRKDRDGRSFSERFVYDTGGGDSRIMMHAGCGTPPGADTHAAEGPWLCSYNPKHDLLDGLEDREVQQLQNAVRLLCETLEENERRVAIGLKEVFPMGPHCSPSYSFQQGPVTTIDPGDPDGLMKWLGTQFGWTWTVTETTTTTKTPDDNKPKSPAK